mmetsp:Transcript_7992/g.17161  ORF Transcript_7992/g.17161 Transcript_7992/m.17161 type:complete len:225 (+) Transcript_7992:566-1240(+)
MSFRDSNCPLAFLTGMQSCPHTAERFFFIAPSAAHLFTNKFMLRAQRRRTSKETWVRPEFLTNLGGLDHVIHIAIAIGAGWKLFTQRPAPINKKLDGVLTSCHWYDRTPRASRPRHSLHFDRFFPTRKVAHKLNASWHSSFLTALHLELDLGRREGSFTGRCRGRLAEFDVCSVMLRHFFSGLRSCRLVLAFVLVMMMPKQSHFILFRRRLLQKQVYCDTTSSS